MSSNYYVYAYLRENGTPYYVGKGKGKRAYDKRHTVNLPNDISRIVFLLENVEEQVAHQFEMQYIRQYGRIDDGSGILRNLTNGGEGSSGRILSEEIKQKIRISLKDRPRTTESKLKQSRAMKGKKPWNAGLKCDGTTNARKPPNMTGYKWINNGVEQTKLAPTKELPEGWTYGRIDIRGDNNRMRKKNGI